MGLRFGGSFLTLLVWAPGASDAGGWSWFPAVAVAALRLVGRVLWGGEIAVSGARPRPAELLVDHLTSRSVRGGESAVFRSTVRPLFSRVRLRLVFGSAVGCSQRLGPQWGPRYALFVFAAMLPWQLFATGLSGGGMSLLAQQNILTKIYFPRLYVPTSVVGGALLDASISFAFVIGLMAWFHVAPSWGMTRSVTVPIEAPQ